MFALKDHFLVRGKHITHFTDYFLYTKLLLLPEIFLKLDVIWFLFEGCGALKLCFNDENILYPLLINYIWFISIILFHSKISDQQIIWLLIAQFLFSFLESEQEKLLCFCSYRQNSDLWIKWWGVSKNLINFLLKYPVFLKGKWKIVEDIYSNYYHQWMN